MKRFTIAATLSAMALGFSPQASQAQVILTTSGAKCGGSPYNICFDATLTITNSTTTSTTFAVWLQNRTVSPGAFTQIGVSGMNPSAGYTLVSNSLTTTGSPTTVWNPNSVTANPNGLNGSGIATGDDFGLDAQGNLGLRSNGSVMFSFTLNRGVSQLSLNNVQLSVHSQADGSTCGESTKAAYQRTSGSVNTGAFVETSTCGAGGSITQIVPEPSTYLLMATGLLGLGIAARRRRNA